MLAWVTMDGFPLRGFLQGKEEEAVKELVSFHGLVSIDKLVKGSIAIEASHIVKDAALGDASYNMMRSETGQLHTEYLRNFIHTLLGLSSRFMRDRASRPSKL